MIVHQGYLLKEFLEKSKKYNINQLSSIIGVSRNTLYMMFGYVELSDDAIGRLRSEGISIKGITTETADAATVYSNVAEAPPAYGEKHDYIMVKKELEMKDQLLAAKQDTIDRLDKNLQMAIAQLGAAAKK